MIPPTRILVVTAAMGSGHREVAAELARRLRQAGAVCETVELMSASGRPGRRLIRTYRALLAHAPWLFDAAMRFWARYPRPMEALTALNAGPFEAALAAAVDRVAPDLIVSTYNLSSQCLGRLRRRSRISAPIVTFVLDPGAHPYWVSRDVGLHLAATPRTAAALEAAGAPVVRLAAPVLRPEFQDPPARRTARAALGLPGEARLVLITGGSWGAGNVERTVDVVRRCPDVTPLVLCGGNETLHRRLARRPGVLAVRWTDQVACYLAAADVVVDNAGGLTCWEALSCRRPVVLYDPLVGHGRFNAATLEACGLVVWARTPTDLVRHLHRPPPVTDLPVGPDAAEVVLAAAGGRS